MCHRGSIKIGNNKTMISARTQKSFRMTDIANT